MRNSLAGLARTHYLSRVRTMSKSSSASPAAFQTNAQQLPSKRSVDLEAAFFYPYDAIGKLTKQTHSYHSRFAKTKQEVFFAVKKWGSYLEWKGVIKGYPKKFLSQPALITGSHEARDHPVSPADITIRRKNTMLISRLQTWGRGHIFHKCEDSKSGILGLYFIDSDIESLLDIIIAKQPALNRELISPNATRKKAFDSFKSVTPATFATTKELQAFRAREVPRGDALLLNLNKKCYQDFQDSKSGTVMAIDIESYERNHAYILEIGWSSIAFTKSEEGETVETRSCEHISKLPPYLRSGLGKLFLTLSLVTLQ